MINTTSITPTEVAEKLDIEINEKCKASKLLLRPQINIYQLAELEPLQIIKQNTQDIIQQAEIQIKYSSYIEREKEHAGKLEKLNHLIIPKNFDYSKLSSMSSESREKLNRLKPGTIEEAKKISGVSPSDISVLLIHFGR